LLQGLKVTLQVSAVSLILGLNRFFSAVQILILFEVAYMSEIIISIPRGREAASILGYSISFAVQGLERYMDSSGT
jgi:ABC-type amino acid transport system permease subunit